jgi:hypothetical protein
MEPTTPSTDNVSALSPSSDLETGPTDDDLPNDPYSKLTFKILNNCFPNHNNDYDNITNNATTSEREVERPGFGFYFMVLESDKCEQITEEIFVSCVNEAASFPELCTFVILNDNVALKGIYPYSMGMPATEILKYIVIHEKKGWVVKYLKQKEAVRDLATWKKLLGTGQVYLICPTQGSFFSSNIQHEEYQF